MNFKSKINQIKSKANYQAPNILFYMGIVGMVGTVATGIQGAYKFGFAATDYESGMRAIDEEAKAGRLTEKQVKEMKRDQYKETAVEAVKCFGPTLILGVSTIGCLTKSHNMLTNRIAGLSAAYTTLQTQFGEYRNRVRAEVGEDKEDELYFDRKKQNVKVSDAEGNVSDLEVEVQDAGGYKYLFDEVNSNNWSSDPGYNRIFLQAQENYANDMLASRGHVFLNDIFDGLGMERTAAGAVVGWIAEEGAHVDFGLHNPGYEPNDLFWKDEENSVQLNFNVQGVIFDKLV